MRFDEIENSQPSGYIVRLPFYAQSTRNAHIMLTQTSNITADFTKQNVYEFSK